jgi:hypothetical protein
VTECKVVSRTRVSSGEGPSGQPAAIGTDNGYLIAWNDARGGTTAIYTTTVASHGGRAGSMDIALAGAPAGASPELARLGDGRYALVFESCPTPGLMGCEGPSGVSVVVVGADGQAAGAPIELSPAMPVQRRPYVVSAFNGVYVTFRELDGSGRQVVRVVQLGPDGSPAGGAVMGGGAEGMFPHVGGGGDHLAVAYRRSGGSPEIVVAVLGSSLGVQNEVAVRTGVPEEASNPVVVWAGSGWGVAWEDDRGGDAQIYSALVSPDGTKTTAGQALYDGNGNWPTIASNGRSTVVAFYGFPKGAQVMLSRLDASGAVAGPLVQVTGDSDRGKFPALTYNDKTSEFGIAWQDDSVGEISFARMKCP